jgi:ribosomal protein S18 acetylase RimI-like enzyme
MTTDPHSPPNGAAVMEEPSVALPILIVKIDVLKKDDMSGVIRLENLPGSERPPWTKCEINGFLKTKNHGAFVAKAMNVVAGYCLMSRADETIIVERMIVDPGLRRREVGYNLLKEVAKLALKLNRKYIDIIVRETKMDAIRFLKAMGFKATEVWHEHYESTGEDAFLFKFDINKSVQENT